MPQSDTTTRRVLVTGSTGAIGAPLAAHLLARGHHVRGYARRPSSGLADYIEGDLNDRDSVPKTPKPLKIEMIILIKQKND